MWAREIRQKRIAAIASAAVLLIGGYGGGRLTTGAGGYANNTEPVIGATRPAAPRVVEFRTNQPARPAMARPPVVVDANSYEAQVVGEIAELQSLAAGTDLDLNAPQWKALAGVTLRTQAVRLAYEAQIATSTALDAGRRRIEIPCYASVGDALREKFQAELCAELGEANATEILEKLGARLEGHFGGFGVGVQTLELTPEFVGGRTNYEVTRTVKYWNSVEGENRLTTRRETLYPALQDPDGETWGPLLAVAGE